MTSYDHNTFNEACAELWSALEGRFGNIKTQQHGSIKRPNRMFVALRKRDVEEAKELIISVIWMVTGEQPRLRITQDVYLDVFVTSVLTIDVRTSYGVKDKAHLDVIVSPKLTKESVLKESVDELTVLREEVHVMLMEEYGEEYVRVISDTSVWVSLSPSKKKQFDADGVFGANNAAKELVELLKNTTWLVTGDRPIDTNQTNLKVFETPEIRVAVNIADAETMYVRIVSRNPTA